MITDPLNSQSFPCCCSLHLCISSCFLLSPSASNATDLISQPLWWPCKNQAKGKTLLPMCCRTEHKVILAELSTKYYWEESDGGVAFIINAPWCSFKAGFSFWSSLKITIFTWMCRTHVCFLLCLARCWVKKNSVLSALEKMTVLRIENDHVRK